MLKILELFCGAGGDTPGMFAAGATTVIGVDIDPLCGQWYPGRFIHCDVFKIEQLMDWSYIIDGVDLVWMSPKCESNSRATNIRADNADHADQIAPARAMVERWGIPYIIENVPEAATKFHRMRADVKLNGYSFGLMLDRPRIFECSFPVAQPRYITKIEVPAERRQKCSVYGRLISSTKKGGNDRYEFEKHWRPIEMGITHIPVNAGSSPDKETGRTYNMLSLAVPPAFSKYLVEQFTKRARNGETK